MLYSSINYPQLQRSDEILNSLSGIYDFLNKGNWEIHGRFDIFDIWGYRGNSHSYIEIKIERYLGTYLTLDNYKFFPKEESYTFFQKRITLTFKIYYQNATPIFNLINQTTELRLRYQVLYYELNGQLYNTSLELKINLARALGLIEY